jgi:hypothetical protein
MQLQVIPGEVTTTRIPVNLRVDQYSELWLADTTYIVGDFSDPALEWLGVIKSVQNLIVNPTRVVDISLTAQLLYRQNDGSFVYGTAGEFQFGVLEFGAMATITFARPMGLVMNVATLDIKFGVQVAAEFVDVHAAFTVFEVNAHIDVSGRGATNELGNGTNGSGAGHATVGGSGINAATLGGQAYGSMYEPVTTGSYGGSRGGVAGGRGGGRVRIDVGDEFDLDGTITVDALNGNTPAGSGGGSGGSIWITASHLKGYGFLNANGGDGGLSSTNNSGGGGAGGRIAIQTSFLNEYRGSHDALGGGNDMAANHLQTISTTPVINANYAGTYPSGFWQTCTVNYNAVANSQRFQAGAFMPFKRVLSKVKCGWLARATPLARPLTSNASVTLDLCGLPSST